MCAGSRSSLRFVPRRSLAKTISWRSVFSTRGSELFHLIQRFIDIENGAAGRPYRESDDIRDVAMKGICKTRGPILGTTRGTDWEQNTLKQGRTPSNCTHVSH